MKKFMMLLLLCVPLLVLAKTDTLTFGNFHVRATPSADGTFKLTVFKCKKLLEEIETEKKCDVPFLFYLDAYSKNESFGFTCARNEKYSVDDDYIYFAYDNKENRFSGIDTEEAFRRYFDHKNKTMVYGGCGEICVSYVYQRQNNKMNLVATTCYIEDFSFDCGKNDGYDYLGFSYLRSVHPEKIFEVKIMLNVKFTKDVTHYKGGVLRYKGQSEFLNLAFKQKKGDVLIFDEIYKGKITGQYALTTEGNGGSAMLKASYVRKDGKKFELEVLEWQPYPRWDD